MKPKTVESATLDANDCDFDTPRTLKGTRGTLLLSIFVPNHPDYVRSTGEKYTRLVWCDHCKGYRFNGDDGMHHDFECSKNRTKNNDYNPYD